LDLLGFIRPNRDFSKGYEQKNKKNRLASQVVHKTSHALLSFVSSMRAASGRGSYPVNKKIISIISEFVKQMQGAWRQALLAFGAPASLPPLASWNERQAWPRTLAFDRANSSWIAPSDT
jgi:hypothetical protein